MDKVHRGNHSSNIQFVEGQNLIRNKNIKILEIGSGTGAFVKYLKDKGVDVKGTEYSEEAILLSKRLFGDLGIIQMSGDDIHFPDNTFDLVLSFDVFEHIPDTDKHLQEVRRVLKPKGVYAFGTPNKITNIPWEIIDKKSLNAWKKYHCSLHTYRGLKDRLAKNSLTYNFIWISLVNDYFLDKIKRRFGAFGVFVVKRFSPDKLPHFMKTNFYVIARKDTK